MVLALVATHPCCGQRQHRAQALTASFDQMRGDFRDARRVFAGHTGADQLVHRDHVIGK